MAMLHTKRLVLRRWREQDLGPFARMNSDPRVMEYFPASMSRADSDALVARIERGFDSEGFGLWALELADAGDFIGFTGLQRVADGMPFAPAVEVGWRLGTGYWGRGLASEAALAAIADGFEAHDLGEIVAYTYSGNARSRALMERLGMSRDPVEDFAHPALAREHQLSDHVLYRLPRTSPHAR
jgi:RimJ/RimL family protein N-acetyltransferase